MFHQTMSVFIFRLKYVCRGELQHIKSSSFSIKHLAVQAISCHSKKKRFLLSISSSTVKMFNQTGSVFIFRLKYVCRGELQHIKSSSISIKHLTVQTISCHSKKKRFLLSISSSTVKMFHQTVSVFIFRLKYVCRGELLHIKSSSFQLSTWQFKQFPAIVKKRFLLSISSSTVKLFHQTMSVFIFRLKNVCRGELQHIKSSFSIKHLTVQAISCQSQKKISTLTLEFDSENVPPDGVRFHISVGIRLPR